MTDPMTATTTAKAGIAGWMSGLAAISVLGIPAGAFIAALVASALNNTAEVVPGRSIPQRLMRVLFDALVGGWIAMALIRLPAFRGYGVQELGATIAAPLVTLLVPAVGAWLKENGKQMANDLWGIVKDWLSRWFGRKE